MQPTGLRATALTLTLMMLLANACWNYLFFRAQSMGKSLVLSAAHSLVALVLLGLLTQLDRLAASFLSLYVAYLPYANWWGYAVWRANQPPLATRH